MKKQELQEGSFTLLSVLLKKGKPAVKSTVMLMDVKGGGQSYRDDSFKPARDLLAHEDLVDAISNLSPILFKILPFSFMNVIKSNEPELSAQLKENFTKGELKNEEFVVATGIDINQNGNNESDDETRSVVIHGYIIDNADNKLEFKTKVISLYSSDYGVEGLIIDAISEIEQECELYCTEFKSKQLDIFETA